MVSFAMGIGSLYGGMPTSMIQSRTTQPKKTTKPKSLVMPRGVSETSPGNYKDSKGNQLIKQGDQFYTLPTVADSAFGYITVPTLYKPPPETKKERVEKRRIGIEAAVGSKTPIFEDLPQPEESPIETIQVPEDATPEQKEEARLKEEARFRQREQERQARRNQLRTFSGQRRSLLRPAARRPYYA